MLEAFRDRGLVLVFRARIFEGFCSGKRGVGLKLQQVMTYDILLHIKLITFTA